MHISAIIADGATVELGPQQRKATALTPDLHESHLDLWVDGGSSAGFWGCGVGSFTAVREGYSEVCHILSGTATVETDNGEVVQLVAGSTLVMPSGWRGTWQVHSPLRKVFVTVPDREL